MSYFGTIVHILCFLIAIIATIEWRARAAWLGGCPDIGNIKGGPRITAFIFWALSILIFLD
jgi:hypothetical protein